VEDIKGQLQSLEGICPADPLNLFFSQSSYPDGAIETCSVRERKRFTYANFDLIFTGI